MGGVFSGQRGSKKRVVESCNAIDTTDLNRWRLLKAGTNRAGSLEWRRGNEKEPSSSVGYTLAVESGAGTLWLQYQVGQPAERFDYPVRLVTTGCHLGGVRWWFICPLSVGGVGCGRRVRKLYLRGKYFGCRHCHNLAYRSSQESDSRVYAAVRSGLDFDRFGRIEGMSVSQLGFTLKVLTFEQKRLDRLGKRLDRIGRRNPKGDG
jgi:hypothetical protein